MCERLFNLPPLPCLQTLVAPIIQDVCERLLDRLRITPVTVQPSIDDKQVVQNF